MSDRPFRPLRQHVPGTIPETRGAGLDRLWTWLMTLSLAAFAIPYTTNFLPWAYGEGLFPLRPAYYLLLTAVPCLGLGIMRRPEFTRTTILMAAIPAIALLDAAVLRRFVPDNGVRQLVLQQGAILVALAVFAVALGALRRRSTFPILVCCGITLAVACGANILEWFGFLDLSQVAGRSAGFHEDPNNASIVIVLSLSVLLTIGRDFRVGFAALAFSVLGVAPTLSRSGILALLAIAVVYLAQAFLQRPGTVLKCVAVAVPALVIAIGVMLSNTSSDALRNDDVRNRISAVFKGDQSEMASSERLKDLQNGISAIRLSPIVGHGTGAGSFKWAPHNQLLSTWIDSGIFTALPYLAILVSLVVKCLTSRLRGAPCLVALLVFIPFSQILLTLPLYWFTALFTVNWTSGRFLTIMCLRPAPQDAPAPAFPGRPTSSTPRHA